MRIIKFRAHPISSTGVTDCTISHFGDLLHNHTSTFISHKGSRYKVDPKTVSQFTGLYDKDGNPVYEHDVIRQ